MTKRNSSDILFCEYVMSHYYDPQPIKIYYSKANNMFYAWWADKYNAEYVSRAASDLNNTWKKYDIKRLEDISIRFYKKDNSTYYSIEVFEREENKDIKFLVDTNGDLVYRNNQGFGSVKKADLPLEISVLLDRIQNYIDESTIVI